MRSNIKYINANVALTKYIYTVFVTRCDVKCGGRCVTSMWQVWWQMRDQYVACMWQVWWAVCSVCGGKCGGKCGVKCGGRCVTSM